MRASVLRIAVCDDDHREQDNMTRLLREYGAEKNVDFAWVTYASGVELLADLEKGHVYDVYCLDIVMPGLSGMEAAREIRLHDQTAPILFFTTSAQFAVESYAVRARNYILKPVTREKFFAAFDDLLEHLDQREEEESVVLQSCAGLQKIVLANLVYAEVYGRSVVYHLRSGKKIECLQSFAAVCEVLLQYDYFLKPHRSYLVNQDYIDSIDSSRIMLRTGEEVPIAQGRAREIKQQYLAYQMKSRIPTF